MPSRNHRGRSVVVALLSMFAMLGVLVAPAEVASAAPTEAPTNLAPNASTVSSNPTLTWDPIVGVSDYRIDLATDPGFASKIDSSTVANTAYTYTAELPAGDYYWRLAGVSGGTGPFAEATFTKDQAAGPAVTSPEDGKVFSFPDEPTSLAWEPIPGMRSYIVEVDDSPDFLGASRSTVSGPAITYVNTPAIGVTQYWRVRGASGGGGSGVLTAWSPEVRTFTVQWPAKPQLVVPPNTIPLTTVTDVELEWTPVPGADNYELQVSLSTDFSGSLIVNRNNLIGTRWVPFETLDNGSYYWRVRAVNAGGKRGEWSDTSAFTRGWPDIPVQTAPTNGAVITDTDLVQFDPITRASHYEIQYGTTLGLGTSCKTIQTSITPVKGGKNAPGSCALLGNAAPTTSKTIYWRVHGLDSPENILGLFSPIQNFMLVPRLESPTFLAELESPANGASVATPVLTWSPMDLLWDGPNSPYGTGIQTYDVTVKDKDGTTVDSATTESTSYVPQVALDPAGNPHSWSVVPTGYAGGGAPETRTFNVAAPTTGAAPDPLTPAAGAADLELPGLTWTPVAGAVDYVIQVRPEGNLTWQTPFSPVTQPGYTHTTFPYMPTGTGDCPLVSPNDFTLATETCGAAVNTGLFIPGTYEWSVVARDGVGATLATGATSTFEILAFGEIDYQAPDRCLPADPCTAVTSSPMFNWEPDPRADRYAVSLAFDVNFTNINRDYTLYQSQFLPREELPDNNVGQAYYWHVQPCGVLCSLSPVGRPAPSSAFQKRSAPVVLQYPTNGSTVPGDLTTDDPPQSQLWRDGCIAEVGKTWDDRCTMRFEWTDYLVSNASDLGARQYRIQISTTPTFESTVDDEFTDQTFYTPEGKTLPTGPLYWRVRVYDASNNLLTWSSTGQFTYSPPGPVLKTPVAGAGISGLPAFSWEVLPYAAQYEFEMYKNGDVNASPTNRVLKTATHHAQLTPFSGLPLGEYAWRVRGRSGDSVWGPWSEVRLVELLAVAPTLYAPLEDEQLEEARVLFSWSNVEGAARYRLLMADNPTLSGPRENIVTVMQAYAPKKQVPTGTWYWHVEALDGDNNVIGVSPTWSFVRDTRDLPSEPLNVQVANGAGRVTVTWDPPIHAGDPAFTAYEATISGPDGLGGTHAETITTTTSTRTATFNGIINGTSHDVTVRAKTAVGLGDPGTATALPNGCAGTPFTDVTSFCSEIAWLYTQSITNGTTLADGTRLYKPTDAVSRQAMAAFLHRYDGNTPSTLTEPFFADVGPTHPFFDDIQWMAQTGLSTGTPQPGGKPLYKPASPVSRQAMAAFLHRYEGGTPSTLDRPFFKDVSQGAPFYEDIQWMADSGLSTGTPDPPGKPLYKPTNAVSRQAMAAFLFRFDQL